MKFNPHDILVEDVDAVAGQLIWILYEVLEDIDPHRAAEIAVKYGRTITLSCTYVIDEKTGADCLKAICDGLDSMSKPGEYFGFPKDSDNVLGWFDETSGTMAA